MFTWWEVNDWDVDCCWTQVLVRSDVVTTLDDVVTNLDADVKVAESAAAASNWALKFRREMFRGFSGSDIDEFETTFKEEFETTFNDEFWAVGFGESVLNLELRRERDRRW